ncbi:unnamed protein product [Periconia digitata]|uniref:AB hydrolase-1 domain-containing protein n=1 Tax=Periconia digitata TaxID=1303443 RepID=A0A9W4UDS2_9PLEO|nr:unnamed protein product [Periconia digitata]
MSTSPLAEPSHRLLGAANKTDTPLIICFHGSGESCEPSWNGLAHLLESRYRILLFERGPHNPNPTQATSHLLDFLKAQNLAGPYVLVAHSYGGAFARTFMHRVLKSVAGVVLVETGQEGGLDPKIAAAQTRKRILGQTPLCVIRGNSFIHKQKSLEAEEIRAVSEQQRAAFTMQRTLLEASDKEDERMKKEQLQLSRNARYIHIPDCGHHVIRDRPEAVADEVDWVVSGALIASVSSWWQKLAMKLEWVVR